MDLSGSWSRSVAWHYDNLRFGKATGCTQHLPMDWEPKVKLFIDQALALFVMQVKGDPAFVVDTDHTGTGVGLAGTLTSP